MAAGFTAGLRARGTSERVGLVQGGCRFREYEQS